MYDEVIIPAKAGVATAAEMSWSTFGHRDQGRRSADDDIQQGTSTVELYIRGDSCTYGPAVFCNALDFP